MTRIIIHLTLAIASTPLLLGCDEPERAVATGQAEAHELDGHECAACGMIVRDQPSPRGQLVHRDGSREYFCSIADMLTYLEAPSPHGPATSVFVEAMPPEAEDPLARETAAQPWTAAEGAAFVTGFERERIMGTPYLTYASREDAQRVAETLGARVVSWNQLGNR